MFQPKNHQGKTARRGYIMDHLTDFVWLILQLCASAKQSYLI